MINIVFVIDTIESPYAGTEKQLLEILGRLDRTRFRPHLVCLRNSDWLKTGDVDCEITVMELGSFFSFEFFRCRRRFARFCREQKVDIVQTFFRDGNLAGAL
ncbi:MAG: glycosyl transferase group 1, partial [candidate division Zixibacteria bacterium]|nr:glycosyl transferase group 1 [candidate division Zixibacteria bacterium]